MLNDPSNPGELARVIAHVRNVEDANAPTGPHDARDLANRQCALCRRRHIVNRKARHDDVNAIVLEWQFAHVAVAHRHPISDPLRLRVGDCGAGGICVLVRLRPQIDTDRETARHTFRRTKQHESMAATNVEHCLIAAKGQTTQQPIAGAQLAETTAREHEQGRGGK